MALDTIVRDPSSGIGQAVVTGGIATSTGPLVDTQAGFAALTCEVDDGEVIGSRTMREPVASVFNRLSTGRDTLQFSDYFNATAQNTALWSNTNTTFTIAFGTAGYNVFNNSAITTTGASQILKSYRTFSLFGQAPLTFEFSEFRAAVPATNQQAEAGLFLSAGTPFTPADGVYFRFTSNGLFGVLNYNGTETSQQLLDSAHMVINDNTTYRIVVYHYRVEFWGASTTSDPRILLGVIAVPSANGPPFSAVNAPIAFRLFHSGTAGSAVQWKIANAVVAQDDIDIAKPWSHQMAGMGLAAYQGQDGGTMGTTALYTNSLAAGAGAAATNTTAALGTGLGGQFSVQPTLTAATDGIICSYQNPATAVAQTGRTLYITSVSVQGLVTTAFTGGPVYYAYSLAFGHTAVSLATAEGAAAKAARRVALGYETYVVTAAVGTLGQGVTRSFTTPIVVNAGEFVALVAKNQGTVTSAGVITLLVTFDGYFE